MYNYDSITLMSNLYEGVYVVDKTRKIVFWNKGCEKITGFTSEEVVNSYCFQNILQHIDSVGTKLCKTECPLSETLKTGKIQEREVFLHHKQGYRVPVSIKSMPIFDEFNKVVAAIEVFTDTRFKENKYEENRRLKKIMNLDPLTQIYNRRYMEFQLETAVNEYDKFESPFGVIFIDIDHFKSINDTYGHIVGDEILKIIAKTISIGIKSYDIAARFGGEEFLVIVKQVDLEILKTVSEKIRILCKNSILKKEDDTISVTVSIGATLFNIKETFRETIHRADELMYKSKITGRDKCTVE
jgi:diguanylate cyclase (GGDEF)-like protein/PAS domain S-box-containing protein